MARVKSKKFNKKAGGLKKKWKTAKKQMEDEGDIFGVDVDDGPYITCLTGFEVKESAGGWPYVDWSFTVLEGESEDEVISRRSGIETEENLVWLMRDFARFGLDVDDLDIDSNDDLEEIGAELVKAEPKVRVMVKTNNAGFQNVFINKVIEIEETSGNGDEALEKGDRVEGEIKGTDYPGVVKKVKGDIATVKFDDGDEEDIELDELTKLEAEPEDDDDTGELSVGDKVEVSIKDKDLLGTVKKINEEDEEVTVLLKKSKKKVKVPVDDVTIIV